MNTLAALCGTGVAAVCVYSLAEQVIPEMGRGPAQAVKASSDIRQLQTVAGMYYQETGAWPRGDESRSWHVVLVESNYLPASVLSDGLWLDPWGKPYSYLDREDPARVWSAVTQGAAVYSFGPDGLDQGGAGDDVVLDGIGGRLAVGERLE